MTENEIIQTNEELSEEKAFDVMKANIGFQLEPYDGMIDLEDTSRFRKLSMSSAQKMQISALLQQTPQALATGTLAKAYIATFPEGLPHVLSPLKQGGYGSLVHANGKIAGHASFYPLKVQSIALGAFTVLSAVTGQYFLTQINSEMKIVNQKLDEILGFLYGDKKAELSAEISFAQYAYSNFSTMMLHDDQRSATIGSLQSAKKVAMKDIEFYLSDLEATVRQRTKDYDTLSRQMDKALRIKDSIEMSRQLYVISGLLELYYSQNYEKDYIRYVENDMISYVNICDSSILSGLSVLQGKFTDFKASTRIADDRKERLEKITACAETYKNGNDSPVRTALESSLEALHKKAEYIIDSDGNIYVKRLSEEG